MPRFAISYQVCTVCIDDDTTCGLQANHFHLEIPKVLAAHQFTEKIKRTMYTYPEGTEKTLDDVKAVANAIYQLDAKCDYINQIILSTIDEEYDLLTPLCGCEKDEAAPAQV